MFIFCYFYCFFCPHVTLIIPDGGGGANPLLGVWALKLTESPHLNFLALLLVQTFVVGLARYIYHTKSCETNVLY